MIDRILNSDLIEGALIAAAVLTIFAGLFFGA